MGLLSNLFKGQLVNVIEWSDNTNNTIVYKYDRGQKDIMYGAQLTVRESQVAIVVNEGEIADVYEPGRYELTTANMPVLTALRSWRFGFKSPFKAEVYFINTKQFISNKWGTTNPIMLRDKEFGVVRMRAFGSYAFRISDPVVFLKEIFGNKSIYTVDDIHEYIKNIIVSSFSDMVAEKSIPIIDIATQYEEIGELVQTKVSDKLSSIGIQISNFVIQNISMPDDVEKAIDKKTSMGIIGDLNSYVKYQAAESIDKGNNTNSFINLGAGLGIVKEISKEMSESFNQDNSSTINQNKFCANCGEKLNEKAKFCSNCGNKIQ